MADGIYLLLTAGLFGLAMVYVAACERLRGKNGR